MAVTFVFAAASVWACGDDTAGGGIKDAEKKCGADDPETDTDESECRELATVDSGRQAITTRGCPKCHGDDMSGADKALEGKDSYKKTITGEDVFLYPPNLTNDDTGIKAYTDDKLAYAIRSGIDENSQQLCPQMTHFAKMSDFEVYSIVLYLRSVPPVVKQVPRSVCPPTKSAGQ